jgi:tRNA 2-thiouridine synthesizing protein A
MAGILLDVRGKICPVPLLLTKRKLESMGDDELLEVIGDFPQTKENIQELVKRTGNEVLKVEESRGEFRILIRRIANDATSRVRDEDLSCKSPEKKKDKG